MAQTHAGFWYLLQEQDKAAELQKGLIKANWLRDQEPGPSSGEQASLSSQALLLLEEQSLTELMLHSVTTGVHRGIFPFATLILPPVENQTIVFKAEN